jgi:hypothetical protein
MTTSAVADVCLPGRRSAVQSVAEAVQHILEHLGVDQVDDRPVFRGEPFVRGFQLCWRVLSGVCGDNLPAER